MESHANSRYGLYFATSMFDICSTQSVHFCVHYSFFRPYYNGTMIGFVDEFHFHSHNGAIVAQLFFYSAFIP